MIRFARDEDREALVEQYLALNVHEHALIGDRRVDRQGRGASSATRRLALPQRLLVATAAGIVVIATTTLIQCLVFWLPRAAPFCEDLFQMFLMVAFYPQHGFSFLVRLVLFTLIPAGFVTMLPVEAVRDGDALKLLAVLAAAAFYAALAVLVFERGLKRYASGNQMLEMR